MSTPPATLNAKERRKLQRQQQMAAEATTVAVKTEIKKEIKKEVKTETKKETKTEAKTETKTEAKGDGELNAKERRKLQRQQQQAAATTPAAPAKAKAVVAALKAAKADAAPETATVTATAGERLNAKQRRLLQRKEARGDEPEAEKKDETQKIGKKRKRKSKATDDEDPEAKKKRIHLTLFVGQLPFKCTEAMVRKHFDEAGEITLRMLTDKKTKKFKGTAFIEVQDSKALGAALSRHHTLLNGRRINVELTASGGGNNSEQRREKIDSLRKKQSLKQIEKTRALVQKHIDAPGSKIKPEDVDERMIDYLSWFDYETAKKAMDEYNRCVSDRVKNTKAFFMGILKRFRQTDGVE